MTRFLLLAALLILAALPARAQDLNTLLDIPEGATLVNLSATERVEVDQDLLTAYMNYEAENADPKVLQDEINKTMAKAVEKAKSVASVKTATQSYHVYPFDPAPQNARSERKWRGSQGLMLKGKQADDLLQLVGDLQELGLSMSNLSYSVSPELMEETQNAMLEAALNKLMVKADRTAKALGKSQAELLNVHVDIGSGFHPPIAMSRMEMAISSDMGAKMAAPVATPGQSDITLVVSAQVMVK